MIPRGNHEPIRDFGMSRSGRLRALITHEELDGKKPGLIGPIQSPSSKKGSGFRTHYRNKYNPLDFFEAEMIPGTGLVWTNPPGWGSPGLIGGLPGAGSSVFALGVGYTVINTAAFQQSVDIAFGDYLDLGNTSYGPV